MSSEGKKSAFSIFKELARESVIFTQLYVILWLVDISAAQVSIILLTFEVR